MTNSFGYSVFGLQIGSEIELPELLPTDLLGEPDVRIGLGSVPAMPTPDAGYSANGEGASLFIEGVARYWINGGSQIVVQPEPGVPMRNVRLFLLGSAMGLLVHQRGNLPLHANAVEIGDQAYAFMGRSGSGKSTLAAAFHDRGFRVIADDVCVVRFDDAGGAFACPGIPRLRLWEEALEASGRTASVFERSYSGDDSIRKYDVPVGLQDAVGEPIPLGGLFLLAEGDGVQLSPLHGLEAVDAIFANTYRGKYAAMAGTTRDHWDSSLKLVRTTPLFCFRRRFGFDGLDAQCAQLLQFIEGLGGSA